jgi:mRNA interferase RelE/StbE
MAYRLEVSHTAHHQIRNLPPQTQKRINKAIVLLSENPHHPGNKKLTAREGYRIRVGDYRVLYQIDDVAKIVTVYRVRARGDVYRI